MSEALEVFNYSLHTFQTQNPENGTRVSMGQSYVFAAPPTDPDQRTITLTFPAMKYYFNSIGDLDETINPGFNMLSLINFYQGINYTKAFNTRIQFTAHLLLNLTSR